MFCIKCGQQLPNEAQYCFHCGSRVYANSSQDKEIPSTENEEAKFKTKTFKMLKLYRVYSIINNFRFKDDWYDNVRINWFIKDRQESPVPLPMVISNYGKLSKSQKENTEKYIKERFTYDEAKKLREYLEKIGYHATKIEERSLPINEKTKPYAGRPDKEGIGYIELYKRENYQLPIKVEGIFAVDLDKDRITGEKRETLISENLWQEIKKREDKG